MDHLAEKTNPVEDAPPAESGDLYGGLMPVRRLAASPPDDAIAHTADGARSEQEIGTAFGRSDGNDPIPAMPAGMNDGAGNGQTGQASDERHDAPPDPTDGHPAAAVPVTEPGSPPDSAEERPIVHDPEPVPEVMHAAETPAAQVPNGSSIQVPPVRWDTLHAMGQLALNQGDPATAADWLWLTRLAFPDVFHGYTDGALALADLGQFEDGRRLLHEAAHLFHNEPAIPVTWAQLEARAGNLSASVDHWRTAVEFPSSAWWICTRLVEALEQLSRFDEADAVLQEAVRTPRFRHPWVLSKAVTLAAERKDWPAVTERLLALGDAAPVDDVLAIDLYSLLVALRDEYPPGLDALSRASWVAPVMASAQTASDRLIHQARLAQVCGRLEVAMERLAALRPVMPAAAEAYLRVEAILRDAGSASAADALLNEAIGRLPDDVGLWVRIGDVLEMRGDWKNSVAHWTAMAQRFPGNHYPGHRLQQAMLRMRDEDPDAEVPEAAPPLQTAAETADLRDLALAFESLGGTGFAGGCEFGGVQRFWGAEPLGLFRWATVSPQTLIDCLENRFEGIGDEAQTELFESDESSVLLWEIHDRHYGYDMHSFIPVATMPRDRMMLTACRRMQYLTKKLLEDLQTPTKIFVHKLAGRRLAPEELEALGQAVTQYPGLRLLCVCPADAQHPAGEIEVITPDLTVASMDFSTGHDWAPRVEAWEALCRRIQTQWQPAEPVAAEV